MSDKKPTEPYKKIEYDIYCIWASLPAYFKSQPEQVLREKLGVDDPFLLELASIKNRTQFSQKFSVSMNTLQEWATIVDNNPNTDDIKKWAKKLTKNVVMGVYNQAIKKGGENARLWVKWVEDWKETSAVDVSGQLSHITYEIVQNEGQGNTNIPQDDIKQ